jgi:hypothetical protein
MGVKLTEMSDMQADKLVAGMEPTLHSISCVYVGLAFCCKMSWETSACFYMFYCWRNQVHEYGL